MYDAKWTIYNYMPHFLPEKLSVREAMRYCEQYNTVARLYHKGQLRYLVGPKGWKHV